jgi:predicted type IV restriction endonuclease
MNEQQVAHLEETVSKTLALIQRFRDKDLGEQNTKASLIDPILDALGWNIRDPDEVHREYKPTSKDCPVDYALKLLRKPRLFVEAKGLGETLSDRKWITQVLGYAIVAGVEWCVLTDGDEYRIYNATAAVDAEEKLLCKIKLSEASSADSVKTLVLISKTTLEGTMYRITPFVLVAAMLTGCSREGSPPAAHKGKGGDEHAGHSGGHSMLMVQTEPSPVESGKPAKLALPF